MKKSILLSLFCMIGTTASAYDAEIDSIFYNFNKTNKTAVVVGYGYGNNITIPSNVLYEGESYSVTSIGDKAFQGRTNLISVTIGNNVTTIGIRAFHECTGLTSVTIGNSVTSIGSTAFKECSALTSITIPNSVTSIGSCAFERCTGLTSITIPNSVTSIGNYAFYLCNGLTSITIPNSVTSIGEYAFSNCNGLTSITIPNSMTSIGNYAFYLCNGLTSITIPNSVTSIGSYAFAYCKGLTSITIPNSVTSIGNSAFLGCTGLTSVTIPNSVTSIREYAFQNCTGLTSVNIPNSVTDIGDGAFSGCTGLTSINIPNSVTTIRGFSGCTGLTSITIPNSVTTIGGGAFSGCTDLTFITIPNSVTTIESGAFSGCIGLTFITIPNSVTTIESGAFSGCSNFEKILVTSGNTVYDSRDNCNAIITTFTNELILGCKATAIPNSVISIKDGAFNGCTGLTSVNIPNSVTSIGVYAFSGCSNIEKITVANDNTVYDSRDNCNAIINTATNELILGCKATAISNSVTTIGSSAFLGCTGLTSITIPNSVTSIGSSAFSGCTGLTSITIPNSITRIEDYTFTQCTGLTSITIPNSVSSIGSSAFSGCTGLTSITIPNSVTRIEDYTFYQCTGLTSITIPSSVAIIGYDAFYKCNNLKLIICDNEMPPSAEYASFPNAFAIVPSASIEQYKKARGWSKLIFNGAVQGESTQTTITLTTHSSFTDVTATMNGTQYTLADEQMVITGLKPNTTYTIDAKGKYGDINLENTLSIKTKGVDVDFSYSTTNFTITLKGKYDAGDAIVEKCGFEGYSEGSELTLDKLVPGEGYLLTFYVLTSDGQKFQRQRTVRTRPIGLSCIANPGVTTCQLTGDYYGVVNATVLDYGFTDHSGQKEVTLHGLDPNTKYFYTFYIDTKEGGRLSREVTFTTSPLTLTTLQPKVATPGNVIVAAQSNIEDEEKNVGFEWRRTDWTDDFKSNEGAAYLYEGMMEGYIRNLNTDKLWKFRPYYESNSGKRYYGDWMGLDPTNTSYFEPTVHTYAMVQVDGNTAQVRGYAMRGSDNTAQQGFKYWKAALNASREARAAGMSVPKDAQTVEARGNGVMEAALEGLDYDSEYCYVAFVTTSEGETFYGEQQSFLIGANPAGIATAATTLQPVEMARYDLRGRRLSVPTQGLNIVRMSDGTVKKVMAK